MDNARQRFPRPACRPGPPGIGARFDRPSLLGWAVLAGLGATLPGADAGAQQPAPQGATPAYTAHHGYAAGHGGPATATWHMPQQGYAPQPYPPQPYPPQPYPPRYGHHGLSLQYGPHDGPDRPPPEQSDEPSPWALDVAANTFVPLSIGAQVAVEMPLRLLVQLDVGWMPGAYGSLVNSAVQGFGAYDAGVGALIDGALDDGVVVRLSGGWRPFPSAGFEILGGYSYVRLSGSVEPAAIGQVVGGDVAAAVAAQAFPSPFTLTSSLHNFHVGLGWRWVIADHLLLRAHLGYMQTVSSSSRVESADLPEAAALASTVADAELGAVYEEYVKLPVVGLGVGYRF